MKTRRILASLAVVSALILLHQNCSNGMSGVLGSGQFASSGGEQMALGLLSIQQEDQTDGKTVTHYFLKDSNSGKQFEVLFSRPPTDLVAGSTIKVTGTTNSGQQILVDPFNVRVLGSAPKSLAGPGNKTVLVIPINFSDKSVACNMTTLEQAILGSTNSAAGVYSEMSNGSLNFSGSMVAPVQIAYSTAGNQCTDANKQLWMQLADAAVDNVHGAGYAAGFSYKIYILPTNNGCDWNSWAPLNDNWSFGTYCTYGSLYARNLGRNIGLSNADHAAGPYLDTSDIMGKVGLNPIIQTNGPHKVVMGWNKVSEVGPGTYDIIPTEDAPGTGYQVLKVAGTNLYLSYRQPKGYDANLQSQYTDGLSIHTQQSPTYVTVMQASLHGAGASMTDTASGMKITQVSNAGGATLTVKIESTSAACVRAKPTVTVSPTSITTEIGATTPVTMTVKNNDSDTCTATVFNGSGPANAISAFFSSALSLAPGQSGTFSVDIKVSAGAASGPVTLNAVDPSTTDGTHNASASLQVTVNNNNVNCAGGWSPCANGIQTYTITTQPTGSGQTCPFANGATRTCTAGANVDCVGAWGTCTGGSQIYTVSVPQQGTGAACPAANQTTQSCSNCIGSWGACNGGSQTYQITQQKTGSGTLACPFAQGATQSCTVTSCTVSDNLLSPVAQSASVGLTKTITVTPALANTTGLTVLIDGKNDGNPIAQTSPPSVPTIQNSGGNTIISWNSCPAGGCPAGNYERYFTLKLSGNAICQTNTTYTSVVQDPPSGACTYEDVNHPEVWVASYWMPGEPEFSPPPGYPGVRLVEDKGPPGLIDPCGPGICQSCAGLNNCAHAGRHWCNTGTRQAQCWATFYRIGSYKSDGSCK